MKEIEPPKPDFAFDVSGAELTYDPEEDTITMQRFAQEITRQSAVGFQYRTPDAGTGEKDIGNQVTTGTVCDRCGSTNHSTHTSFLVEAHSVAAEIVDYLVEDHDVDAEQLHRTYDRTGEIELAAGKALDD